MLPRGVAYQDSVKHIFSPMREKLVLQLGQFISQFCEEFPGWFWADHFRPDAVPSSHGELCGALWLLMDNSIWALISPLLTPWKFTARNCKQFSCGIGKIINSLIFLIPFVLTPVLLCKLASHNSLMWCPPKCDAAGDLSMQRLSWESSLLPWASKFENATDLNRN